MNPLTNVKNITKLNEIELSKGTTDKKSWHDMYKGSAWIFIGGLAYGLTEGDVLAVFSQYGEIVNINLVRDKKTGKTKGFCFLCYANQKSTILAVDNFNGIKLLNRTIRVDHVLNYKPPKDNENDDDITKQLKSEGCAPQPLRQETSPLPTTSSTKNKKSKKEKKKRKKHKKEADDKSSHTKSKIKKEKHDPGYDKYELPQKSEKHSSKTKKSRMNNSESSTSEESSDESPVNSKKKYNERVYTNKSDRTVSNDFTKRDNDGNKRSSTQKRSLENSESDSDGDYGKYKKSKTSYSEARNTILSDDDYNKRELKSRHNSNSPERLLTNERKNVEKTQSHKQHSTSHSSSSRSKYISRNIRKEIIGHSSSNTEDTDESDSQYIQSREKNSKKHSKFESSHSREHGQSDHRKNDRNHHGYNGDRSNKTLGQNDRRISSDRKNYDDRWSKNTEGSGKTYDHSSHSRKYSDRNDEYSCGVKSSGSGSRDSSKFVRSAQNISPYDKKYSKHRDKDDSRKDGYDRKR